MSRFYTNVIYIIIPIADLTEEIKNYLKVNFNYSRTSMRQSLDNTLVLIKVKEPVSDIFKDYIWYNQDEILNIMATSAWQRNP